MDGSAAPVITRRTLHDAADLRIEHIVARPRSADLIEVEAPRAHGLALPLSGVFARHATARRHLVATANHALLFPAGQPYRISFPGCVGDEVLSLQWSPEVLATALPEAQQRFAAANDEHALLEPRHMVRRNLLWRSLARGEGDPLEIEEASAGLVAAILRVGSAHAPGARRIEGVKEAVALEPGRKWTLGELAQVARMSPYHLAHVFRREVGVSTYAYVLRLRLAQALACVIDTDADITTIALDAGFASHSHFTARFRTLFGVTPAQLRRGAGPRPAELRKIVTAR